MDKGGSCMARQPVKRPREVVPATVANDRLQTRFKSSSSWSIVSTQTDTHQPDAPRIYIRSALKIIDSVTGRHFVVVAHGVLELHFALPGAVNRHHRHTAPQKVFAVAVHF